MKQMSSVIAAIVAAGVLIPSPALAGSRTYTTPGEYAFSVPAYGTLTVEVWGGGGGGGTIEQVSLIRPACNPKILSVGPGSTQWFVDGCAGSPSSFGSNLVAYGGEGGPASTWGFGASPAYQTAKGGVATGGDVNATGGSNYYIADSFQILVGYGGDAPRGGKGGVGSWCVSGGGVKCASYNGSDLTAQGGNAPGAGGGGGCGKLGCPGGASGGYAKKTYGRDQLIRGSQVAVVVGRGGSGQSYGYTGYGGFTGGIYSYWYWNSGVGADGRVSISWTDPPAPLQCNGTPEIFSTPGSYAREVPEYSSLAVEMWGAGGGGASGANGSTGEVSQFAGMRAGGGSGAQGGIGGSGGTASGGDSHVNGRTGANRQSVRAGGSGAHAPFGGNGGTGFRTKNDIATDATDGSAPGAGGGGGNSHSIGAGGGGGSGAYAKKTYAPGDIEIGTTVQVVVGKAGAGAPGDFLGGDGADGRVTIICSQQVNAPPDAPTITAPPTVVSGAGNTYTFRSKDPDGDKVRYEVSWRNNEKAQTLLPSEGYEHSNTPVSIDDFATTSTAVTSVPWTFSARACDDSGASNSCSIWRQETITVNPQLPSVTLTCKEYGGTQQKPACSFRQGDDPITLTWSSDAYAQSCTASAVPSASNWNGSKAANGTFSAQVSPTKDETYTIGCAGSGGSASDSVTINYRQNLPPNAPIVTFNGNEGPFTVRPNTSYTFQFVASDNDTPPDDLNYTISWNDGNPYVWLPSQTTYVRSGPQDAVSAAYTWGYFSENRRATFRAKATDQRGEPSATWTTVTVQCISTQQCNTAEKKLYDSCTNESISCPNGCSGSACNPSPPAKINSFYAKPALIPGGTNTKLYWDVENAKANGCSVSGSNGEVRGGLSGSMASGWETKAITAQTLYTLTCTGLDAKQETAETTVSIVPVFQEF